MVKPFTIKESEDVNRLTVEVGKARVIAKSKVVTLSAAELAILIRLYRAKGHLVSVVQLENAIYEQPGCQEIMGEIKYHICSLRRKLGDNDRSLIYCRRHLGYGMEISEVNWVE